MRTNHHLTEEDDYIFAKQLRRESSPIENKFWFALRAACKDTGIKFRRQQPIHPYIIDFACMKAKLLIELDGLSHNTQQVYDQKRDIYLQQQGYRVLRINNKDVISNLPSVLENVLIQAKALLTQNV